MSTHKALAREWRPQTFDSFIGQEHAVKALQQSLERNEIHHAHLLTGTRGVGKTSLARIFAKGLSCTRGISKSPCEQCEHCLAIENGNFIDLIEIDAASRTKVEDTKELLSQVIYPPVQGRFKIYLIDEVHSLSSNSFNALLKTLEEPPEHVKFILATTDPQKLPVTILSRCLQIHLQNHHVSNISDHLKKIIQQLNKTIEPEAVQQIANAASGSLRDALSLLEQAIAASELCITSTIVSNMLGRASDGDIIIAIQAIIEQNAALARKVLDKFDNSSANYETVMDQMLQNFYEITQIQVLQKYSHESNVKEIYTLAEKVQPEQVQIYIQMLIQAKKDLNLYPSHTTAFNLLVMRMISFTLDKTSLTSLIKKAQAGTIDTMNPNIPAFDNREQNNNSVSASDILKRKNTATTSKIAAQPSSDQNRQQMSASDILKKHNQSAQKGIDPKARKQTSLPHTQEGPVEDAVKNDSNSDWKKVIASNICTGLVKQILQKSTLDSSSTNHLWRINIDDSLENLATENVKKKISNLCKNILNSEISITFKAKKSSVLNKVNHQLSSVTPHADNEALKEKLPLQQENAMLKKFAEDLQAKPIKKPAHNT